ncbi:IclR family transcriptional regulator [Brevibacterium album]|uniref:IclR family transcriptional regulator n=1 Tax=Brevibacterium album TaxID=417948 RepID=UPI00041EBF4A|nr:IclR family transcriptional regulator C-terminal domain-containing protein [Brevibacterium album]
MTAEHRTVSRIIAILETVAAADAPVPLHALAGAADAPKSSVHGFVRGLVHSGYLVDEGRGYVLGAGVHALLGPTGTTLPLLLGETCEEIAVRSGETVTVALRVGEDSVVYVHTEPSAYEVCYSPRLRQRRPLLPTSSGKVFLALADEADRVRALESAEPAAARTFLGELAAIRESGLAFNRGETVPDVGAVAAGVHHAGALIAAVTVAGPLSRVEPRLDRFGALAREVLGANGFAGSVGTAD